MEAKRSRQALLCTALVALLSQNLFIPIVCTSNLEDQKNYYTPDPNAHPPPAVTHPSPPYGSGGGHASPTPSHGTPSHGGTPPSNCGDPPSGGHHHTTPSPGHYHTPPTTTPTTPTPPIGGGYYHSPPTTTPTTPTPTPTTPTPTTPTTPYVSPPTTPYVSPPTTPYVSPPTTPIDPGTPNPPSITIPSPPSITIPSPPFSFNPTSPPFTCTYWRNHPTLVWGLFGFWGTVGNAFGTPSVPGLGANMNLLQALSNSRTDGYGELYREGTAALLNSMAHTRFPYSTNQVRDSFVTALSSNKAASAQAQLFKLANEGRIKPRA